MEGYEKSDHRLQLEYVKSFKQQLCWSGFN